MNSHPSVVGARRTGRLRPGERFGLNDHGCWVYSDDGERAAVAAAWLTDGVRLGQRGLYVADVPFDTAVAELASLMEPLDLDDLQQRGALVVLSCTDLYDPAVPIEARSQLRAYDTAVREAIADGFAGLRVAADATPLLTDPARHPAHLHWEQFADRYMTTHPLAPLCMYDGRRLDGLHGLLAGHALQGPQQTAFAILGDGPDRARIIGELDVISDDALRDVLRSLPADDVQIDLSDVSFADGHATWRLHEELVVRRDARRRLALVGAPAHLRRVWELCGFDPAVLAA